MTKKIFLSLIVAGSLSLYAAEGTASDNQGDSGSTDTTQESQTNDTIVDKTFALSQSLVDLTNKLVDEAANANGTYTKAMLQLSQDIGTMADRINTMADKIVQTQEIQSKNFQATQENMLQAQRNMVDLTDALANRADEASKKVAQNLEKSKEALGMAQNSFNNTQQNEAVQKMKEAIASSPSVSDLVGLLDNTKPQYRYMVMNAIKEKMAAQSDLAREKTLEALTKTQEIVRENKEFNMQGMSAQMTQVQAMKPEEPFNNMGGFDRGNSSMGDSINTMSGMSGASMGDAGAAGAGGMGGAGGASSGGMGGM